MAYTVRNLITRSFYLCQVVSRDFTSITGNEIQVGLDLLNSLLNWLTIETQSLPFYKIHNFTAIQNVEKYYIPNLFDIEDLTYNVTPDVRYPSNYQTRSQYFGTYRANNVRTLPANFRAEKTVDGMDIYLYPIPNQNYEMQIVGKFGLTNVTLDTDLNGVYDNGFIEYLRYLLASYICDEYGGELSQSSQKRLSEMKTQLIYLTGQDLTCKKTSVFSKYTSLNWGMVNLFRGMLPPC